MLSSWAPDFTWLHFLLLWVGAAVLMFGLLVYSRQLPRQRSATTVMMICLVAWWVLAVIEVVAILAKLAQYLFDPDNGPLAMVVDVARASGRHDTAIPPPPEKQAP